MYRTIVKTAQRQLGSYGQHHLRHVAMYSCSTNFTSSKAPAVQVHVGLDRAYPKQHPGCNGRHGGSHWRSKEENRTPQSPKQDAEESLKRR